MRLADVMDSFVDFEVVVGREEPNCCIERGVVENLGWDLGYCPTTRATGLWGYCGEGWVSERERSGLVEGYVRWIESPSSMPGLAFCWCSSVAVRLPTKRFRGCFAAGGAGSGDSGVDCARLSDSGPSGPSGGAMTKRSGWRMDWTAV